MHPDLQDVPPASPKPDRRRPWWRLAVPAAGLGLVLAAGGIWLAWPGTSGADPPPLADEADLLAAPQDRTTTYRFAPDPAVLVITFASMHAQALTLNRIGAFVEKARAPRDRVLDDAALTRLIAGQDSFDTFYYGHDYRAADLRRYFATAAADKIALRPEETALQTLLRRQGFFAPGAAKAMISLPPLSANPPVDTDARRTILRHELSHGLYFTNPAYAAYTQHFWTTVLTADARDHFRNFLAAEGYDAADDDLIENETQAYLVHTRDSRFFNPAAVQMPAAVVEALRKSFVQEMPANWLRDRTKK